MINRFACNVKKIRNYRFNSAMRFWQCNYVALYAQKVMIIMSMKRNFSSKRLAGLAAGSMLMGAAFLPSSTKAQGAVETINWSGTANQLWGNGDGFANGDNVNSSVGFSESLLLSAGNGSTTAASVYSGQFTVTIDGSTATYQGVLDVFNNTLDADGSLSDGVSLIWGPNYASGLNLNYSPNTVNNSSLASGLQMLDNGLNGVLPGDAVFDLFDASGANGIQGNISAFDPVAAPEPSTIAMGTLGAAGLLALNRMRRVQKNDISMR